MKKRCLIWIITIAMAAVLLSGCGEQRSVKNAAEGFLKGLVDSDAEEAGKYASADFMAGEQMTFLDTDRLENSFYESMGVSKEDLDETAQKTVSDYIALVAENAYKSYEVGDIKIQDNTAYATTQITLGYDPETSSEIPDEVQEEIEEYQSEHYDELVQTYVDDGEEAMYRTLYNGLIPIIIGDMQKQVDGSSEKTEKAILTLEKTDSGEWLVTAMEEDPADSGSGSTEDTGTDSTAAAAEQEPDTGGTAE